MRAFLIVVCFASAAMATPVKPRVEKRIVISFSRKSGTSITTTMPDGDITVALDVLENGRGPHVDAKLQLGPDGAITSLSATGHHTFGSKIAETFERKGAQAQWKSEEEQGSAATPGFFVPLADIPDVAAWAVQAARKAGGKLKLLPTGEITVEKTDETTISAGGKSRKIECYSVTGLDFTRTHIWMNENGTWFGTISPWFSVVPEGWESVVEPLMQRQTALDKAFAASLTKLGKKPAGAVVYKHARVLDVEHGKWLADQSVVVRGDSIVAVGPTAKVAVPERAEVVDLAGKAILPGLIDMHAHLGEPDGLLNIASGVTTVRDVGNDPDKLDEWARIYDAGQAIGPHVVRFGFIEGRNEKAASSKVTAETPAEAKAAVEYYAKRGYEGIKIYNSVRPELVPLLAKEAHARGMPVTGHIPVHMLAHEAVAAGYDGIEHINMLFLNFFATHDTDTRDTTRFTLVGDKAADFDLASQPVRDFIKLLKSKNTIIDPTLGAFEELLCAQSGKITPGLEAIAARLPAQIQRQLLTGSMPLGEKAPRYRKSFDKLLAMVKLLRDEKIPVVAGTDEIAGLWLHHELELFVRAGISPADAIRMATLDPARVLKLDKSIGSIAVGKRADLFVVDGDPLANIADVAKVVSTMRGGVIYPSAQLFQAVGVK
jgi:imidazolonepropionase-like amidohydrolase